MSAKRIHLASILLVLVLLLAACERPFRSSSDDGTTDDATTTETDEGAADTGGTEDGAAEDVADEATGGDESADTGSEEGAGSEDEANRPDTGTDEGEGAADEQTSGDDGAADDDSATDEGAQQEDGDNAAGEGDDAAGDEATGDEATGDDTTGDEAAGDATGDEAAGEGDDAAGDEATGDEAAGDDATGDETTDQGEADDTTGDADGPMVHIVQAGENLYRIGLQYNVSWVAIAEANNLPNANAIYVGQQLTIPTAEAAPEGTPAGDEVTHVVQAGETLHTIGLQYNVSWTQIAEANGLVNPNYIVVGQVLKIPASAPGPAPQFVHTVQAGETLFILALRYGVVWTDIAAANDIEAPYVIFPGQQLVIPGG
ncbi:MAG: LysM peptidoglycan-binding domain-containing protein [Ardenticatenales bacterium]|nr:LysM peptidoglycan-binding domain-containing protein [Ardenticatenales bacterium]